MGVHLTVRESRLYTTPLQRVAVCWLAVLCCVVLRSYKCRAGDTWRGCSRCHALWGVGPEGLLFRPLIHF